MALVNSQRWARGLVLGGLTVMILAALDPLEGSVVIVPAVILAALGSTLGHSRFRRALYWAAGLVAIGVGAMFLISSLGGLGGTTGHSLWWAVAIAPYPIGWLMALVYAFRTLRERPPNPA